MELDVAAGGAGDLAVAGGEPISRSVVAVRRQATRVPLRASIRSGPGSQGTSWTAVRAAAVRAGSSRANPKPTNTQMTPAGKDDLRNGCYCWV
jgi:hypothetical protein